MPTEAQDTSYAYSLAGLCFTDVDSDIGEEYEGTLQTNFNTPFFEVPNPVTSPSLPALTENNALISMSPELGFDLAV